MNLPSLYRKLTAGFLAVSFFVTAPGSVPLSAASPVQAAAPKAFPKKISEVSLPKTLGEIESVWQSGKDGPAAVLIQDAHGVSEAQRQTEKIIEYLQSEYGLAFVGTEGAAGKFDAQIFKSFPDKDQLDQVFERYYDSGELTGAAGAAVFSPYPSEYNGLEDWKSYEEGFSFFARAASEEQVLLARLSEWSRKIRETKKKEFSSQLLKTDQALEAFEKNQEDLLKVLPLLAETEKPPAGSSVELLLQNDADGSGAFGEEVSKAAAEVQLDVESQPGKKQEAAEFHRRLQGYRTGTEPVESFALYLLEIKPGLKFSPHLASSIESQKKLRDLEGTKFFEEFRTYSSRVMKKLLQTGRQREIYAEGRQCMLLEKLAKLELSRAEWQELSGWKGRAAEWRQAFRFHEAFYRNARAREEALAGNFEKKLVSKKLAAGVLIAGGFHAEGLEEQFKKRGISYVRVRPAMHSLPDAVFYRQHMRGDVSWKSYLLPEDGKLDLYGAFVRGTRDRLLAGRTDLKPWRDQIIRDLAAAGKISAASQYTGFLDETASPQASELKKQWSGNIERFIRKVKELESAGHLNEQNVMNLLGTGILDAVTAAAEVRRSELRMDVLKGDAAEGFLRARSEARNIISESGFEFEVVRETDSDGKKWVKLFLLDENHERIPGSIPSALGGKPVPNLFAYSIPDEAKRDMLNGVWIDPHHPELEGKGLLRVLLREFFEAYPEVRRTSPGMHNFVLAQLLMNAYRFRPEKGDLEIARYGKEFFEVRRGGKAEWVVTDHGMAMVPVGTALALPAGAALNPAPARTEVKRKGLKPADVEKILDENLKDQIARHLSSKRKIERILFVRPKSKQKDASLPRAYYKNVLESGPYTSVEAGTDLDLAAHLGNEKFDLIVIEQDGVNRHGESGTALSGTQILRLIRRSQKEVPSGKDVPVIFLADEKPPEWMPDDVFNAGSTFFMRATRYSNFLPALRQIQGESRSEMRSETAGQDRRDIQILNGIKQQFLDAGLAFPDPLYEDLSEIIIPSPEEFSHRSILNLIRILTSPLFTNDVADTLKSTAAIPGVSGPLEDFKFQNFEPGTLDNVRGALREILGSKKLLWIDEGEEHPMGYQILRFKGPAESDFVGWSDFRGKAFLGEVKDSLPSVRFSSFLQDTLTKEQLSRYYEEVKDAENKPPMTIGGREYPAPSYVMILANTHFALQLENPPINGGHDAALEELRKRTFARIQNMLPGIDVQKYFSVQFLETLSIFATSAEDQNQNSQRASLVEDAAFQNFLSGLYDRPEVQIKRANQKGEVQKIPRAPFAKTIEERVDRELGIQRPGGFVEIFAAQNKVTPEEVQRVLRAFFMPVLEASVSLMIRRHDLQKLIQENGWAGAWEKLFEQAGPARSEMRMPMGIKWDPQTMIGSSDVMSLGEPTMRGRYFNLLKIPTKEQLDNNLPVDLYLARGQYSALDYMLEILEAIDQKWPNQMRLKKFDLYDHTVTVKKITDVRRLLTDKTGENHPRIAGDLAYAVVSLPARVALGISLMEAASVGDTVRVADDSLDIKHTGGVALGFPWNFEEFREPELTPWAIRRFLEKTIDRYTKSPLKNPDDKESHAKKIENAIQNLTEHIPAKLRPHTIAEAGPPLQLLSKKTRKLILSFAEYMDVMNEVYYRKHVQFEKDFQTPSTVAHPQLGRDLAVYGYNIWRKQGRPSKFSIGEMGAGKGQVAGSLMAYAAERAGHDVHWAAFYKALHFYVFERSADLRKVQKKTIQETAHLTDSALEKKVHILKWDASEPGTFQKQKAGFVYNVELFDDLGREKILVHRNGKIERAYAVSYLSADVWRALLEKQVISAAMADKILAESAEISPNLTAGLPKGSVILGRHYFPQLRGNNDVSLNLMSREVLEDITGSLDEFPLIAAYLQKERAHIQSQMERYGVPYMPVMPTPVFSPLYNWIAQKFPALLTFDYFDNEHQGDPETFFPRVYPPRPYAEKDPSDVYLWGEPRNITADVDRRDAVLTGAAEGLRPVYFGNMWQFFSDQSKDELRQFWRDMTLPEAERAKGSVVNEMEKGKFYLLVQASEHPHLYEDGLKNNEADEFKEMLHARSELRSDFGHKKGVPGSERAKLEELIDAALAITPAERANIKLRILDLGSALGYFLPKIRAQLEALGYQVEIVMGIEKSSNLARNAVKLGHPVREGYLDQSGLIRLQDSFKGTSEELKGEFNLIFMNAPDEYHSKNYYDSMLKAVARYAPKDGKALGFVRLHGNPLGGKEEMEYESELLAKALERNKALQYREFDEQTSPEIPTDRASLGPLVLLMPVRSEMRESRIVTVLLFIPRLIARLIKFLFEDRERKAALESGRVWEAFRSSPDQKRLKRFDNVRADIGLVAEWMKKKNYPHPEILDRFLAQLNDMSTKDSETGPLMIKYKDPAAGKIRFAMNSLVFADDLDFIRRARSQDLLAEFALIIAKEAWGFEAQRFADGKRTEARVLQRVTDLYRDFDSRGLEFYHSWPAAGPSAFARENRTEFTSLAPLILFVEVFEWLRVWKDLHEWAVPMTGYSRERAGTFHTFRRHRLDFMDALIKTEGSREEILKLELANRLYAAFKYSGRRKNLNTFFAQMLAAPALEDFKRTGRGLDPAVFRHIETRFLGREETADLAGPLQAEVSELVDELESGLSQRSEMRAANKIETVTWTSSLGTDSFDLYKEEDPAQNRKYLKFFPAGFTGDPATAAPPLFVYAVSGQLRGVYINPSFENRRYLPRMLNAFFKAYPEIRATHPNIENFVLARILLNDYGFGPEEGNLGIKSWGKDWYEIISGKETLVPSWILTVNSMAKVTGDTIGVSMKVADDKKFEAALARTDFSRAPPSEGMDEVTSAFVFSPAAVQVQNTLDWPGKKISRVLVANQDQAVSRLLTLFLKMKRPDLQVAAVSTNPELAERLQKESWDLILAGAGKADTRDAQLLRGEEIIRLIRRTALNLPSGRNVPVVLTTSHLAGLSFSRRDFDQRGPTVFMETLGTQVAGKLAEVIAAIEAAPSGRSELRTLDEFLASDFHGPIILGGTGALASHVLENEVKSGQKTAAVFRAADSPRFTNLRRTESELAAAGALDRMVLVDAGDVFDPMKWSKDPQAVEKLKKLLSKATVIYHLAAQTNTRPGQGQSYSDFAVETFGANVFMTKVLARLAAGLNIPMIYTSSGFVFTLNPLFENPLQGPVTEDTPIPFSPAAQNFMDKAGTEFDAYTARYLEGKADLSPADFTRQLIGAAQIPLRSGASASLPEILEAMEKFQAAKKADPAGAKAAYETFRSVYPADLAFGWYPVSKILPEKDVLALPQGKGQVLRLVNLYGPGLRSNTVVNLHLNTLAKGQPAGYASNVVRDFVAVEDAAEILKRAGEKAAAGEFKTNEIIHVASDEGPYTMERAFRASAKALGIDLAHYPQPVIPFEDDPSLVMPPLNTGKLERLIGYKPQIKLEDGVRRLAVQLGLVRSEMRPKREWLLTETERKEKIVQARNLFDRFLGMGPSGDARQFFNEGEYRQALTALTIRNRELRRLLLELARDKDIRRSVEIERKQFQIPEFEETVRREFPESAAVPPGFFSISYLRGTTPQQPSEIFVTIKVKQDEVAGITEKVQQLRGKLILAYPDYESQRNHVKSSSTGLPDESDYRLIMLTLTRKKEKRSELRLISQVSQAGFVSAGNALIMRVRSEMRTGKTGISPGSFKGRMDPASPIIHAVARALAEQKRGSYRIADFGNGYPNYVSYDQASWLVSGIHRMNPEAQISYTGFDQINAANYALDNEKDRWTAFIRKESPEAKPELIYAYSWKSRLFTPNYLKIFSRVQARPDEFAKKGIILRENPFPSLEGRRYRIDFKSGTLEDRLAGSAPESYDFISAYNVEPYYGNWESVVQDTFAPLVRDKGFFMEGVQRESGSMMMKLYQKRAGALRPVRIFILIGPSRFGFPPNAPTTASGWEDFLQLTEEGWLTFNHADSVLKKMMPGYRGMGNRRGVQEASDWLNAEPGRLVRFREAVIQSIELREARAFGDWIEINAEPNAGFFKTSLPEDLAAMSAARSEMRVEIQPEGPPRKVIEQAAAVLGSLKRPKKISGTAYAFLERISQGGRLNAKQAKTLLGSLEKRKIFASGNQDLKNYLINVIDGFEAVISPAEPRPGDPLPIGFQTPDAWQVPSEKAAGMDSVEQALGNALRQKAFMSATASGAVSDSAPDGQNGSPSGLTQLSVAYLQEGRTEAIFNARLNFGGIAGGLPEAVLAVSKHPDLNAALENNYLNMRRLAKLSPDYVPQVYALARGTFSKPESGKKNDLSLYSMQKFRGFIELNNTAKPDVLLLNRYGAGRSTEMEKWLSNRMKREMIKIIALYYEMSFMMYKRRLMIGYRDTDGKFTGGPNIQAGDFIAQTLDTKPLRLITARELRETSIPDFIRFLLTAPLVLDKVYPEVPQFSPQQIYEGISEALQDLHSDKEGRTLAEKWIGQYEKVYGAFPYARSEMRVLENRETEEEVPFKTAVHIVEFKEIRGKSADSALNLLTPGLKFDGDVWNGWAPALSALSGLGRRVIFSFTGDDVPASVVPRTNAIGHRTAAIPLVTDPSFNTIAYTGSPDADLAALFRTVSNLNDARKKAGIPEVLFSVLQDGREFDITPSSGVSAGEFGKFILSLLDDPIFEIRKAVLNISFLGIPLTPADIARFSAELDDNIEGLRQAAQIMEKLTARTLASEVNPAGAVKKSIETLIEAENTPEILKEKLRALLTEIEKIEAAMGRSEMRKGPEVLSFAQDKTVSYGMQEGKAVITVRGKNDEVLAEFPADPKAGEAEMLYLTPNGDKIIAASRSGFDVPQAAVFSAADGKKLGNLWGDTQFFRDTQLWLKPFENYLSVVLPKKIEAGQRRLTVKILGSSSSQAFTFAAVVRKQLLDRGENPADWKITIETYDLLQLAFKIMMEGRFPAIPYAAQFNKKQYPFDLVMDKLQDPTTEAFYLQARPDILKWLKPVLVDLNGPAEDVLRVLGAAKADAVIAHHVLDFLSPDNEKAIQRWMAAGSWKDGEGPGFYNHTLLEKIGVPGAAGLTAGRSEMRRTFSTTFDPSKVHTLWYPASGNDADALAQALKLFPGLETAIFQTLNTGSYQIKGPAQDQFDFLVRALKESGFKVESGGPEFTGKAPENFLKKPAPLGSFYKIRLTKPAGGPLTLWYVNKDLYDPIPAETGLEQADAVLVKVPGDGGLLAQDHEFWDTIFSRSKYAVLNGTIYSPFHGPEFQPLNPRQALDLQRKRGIGFVPADYRAIVPWRPLFSEILVRPSEGKQGAVEIENPVKLREAFQKIETDLRFSPSGRPTSDPAVRIFSSIYGEDTGWPVMDIHERHFEPSGVLRPFKDTDAGLEASLVQDAEGKQALDIEVRHENAEGSRFQEVLPELLKRLSEAASALNLPVSLRRSEMRAIGEKEWPGFTFPWRNRQSDYYIYDYLASLGAPAAEERRVVDFGVGFLPVTTIELAKILSGKSKVVGIDKESPAALLEFFYRGESIMAFFDESGNLLETAKKAADPEFVEKYQVYANPPSELREEILARYAALKIKGKDGDIEENGSSLVFQPFAKAKEKSGAGNLEFMKADIDFKLPAGQADVIRAMNSLIHVADTGQPDFVKNASGQLKEGGLLMTGQSMGRDTSFLVFQKKEGRLDPKAFVFSVRQDSYYSLFNSSGYPMNEELRRLFTQLIGIMRKLYDEYGAAKTAEVKRVPTEKMEEMTRQLMTELAAAGLRAERKERAGETVIEIDLSARSEMRADTMAEERWAQEAALFERHLKEGAGNVNAAAVRKKIAGNPEWRAAWNAESHTLAQRFKTAGRFETAPASWTEDFKEKIRIAAIHFKDRYGINNVAYVAKDLQAENREITALRSREDAEAALDFLVKLDELLTSRPRLASVLVLFEKTPVTLFAARQNKRKDTAPDTESAGVTFYHEPAGYQMVFPIFKSTGEKIDYLAPVSGDREKVEGRTFSFLETAFMHEWVHVYVSGKDARAALPAPVENLRAFVRRHPELSVKESADPQQLPYLIARAIYSSKVRKLAEKYHFDPQKPAALTPPQIREQFLTGYAFSMPIEFLAETLSLFWLDPELVRERDPLFYEFAQILASRSEMRAGADRGREIRSLLFDRPFDPRALDPEAKRILLSLIPPKVWEFAGYDPEKITLVKSQSIELSELPPLEPVMTVRTENGQLRVSLGTAQDTVKYASIGLASAGDQATLLIGTIPPISEKSRFEELVRIALIPFLTALDFTELNFKSIGGVRQTILDDLGFKQDSVDPLIWRLDLNQAARSEMRAGTITVDGQEMIVPESLKGQKLISFGDIFDALQIFPEDVTEADMIFPDGTVKKFGENLLGPYLKETDPEKKFLLAWADFQLIYLGAMSISIKTLPGSARGNRKTRTAEELIRKLYALDNHPYQQFQLLFAASGHQKASAYMDFLLLAAAHHNFLVRRWAAEVMRGRYYIPIPFLLEHLRQPRESFTTYGNLFGAEDRVRNKQSMKNKRLTLLSVLAFNNGYEDMESEHMAKLLNEEAKNWKEENWEKLLDKLRKDPENALGDEDELTFLEAILLELLRAKIFAAEGWKNTSAYLADPLESLPRRYGASRTDALIRKYFKTFDALKAFPRSEMRASQNETNITQILRFPELIPRLNEIKKDYPDGMNVLMAGLGTVEVPGGKFSPQFVETAAALSDKNAAFTLLDKDREVLEDAKNAKVYEFMPGGDQRMALTTNRPLYDIVTGALSSVFENVPADGIDFYGTYPLRLPVDRIQLVQEKFEDFDPGAQKRDLILSTLSLAYALRALPSEQAYGLFKKYLSALNPGGRLLISRNELWPLYSEPARKRFESGEYSVEETRAEMTQIVQRLKNEGFNVSAHFFGALLEIQFKGRSEMRAQIDPAKTKALLFYGQEKDLSAYSDEIRQFISALIPDDVFKVKQIKREDVQWEHEKNTAGVAKLDKNRPVLLLGSQNGHFYLHLGTVENEIQFVNIHLSEIQPGVARIESGGLPKISEVSTFEIWLNGFLLPFLKALEFKEVEMASTRIRLDILDRTGFQQRYRIDPDNGDQIEVDGIFWRPVEARSEMRKPVNSEALKKTATTLIWALYPEGKKLDRVELENAARMVAEKEIDLQLLHDVLLTAVDNALAEIVPGYASAAKSEAIHAAVQPMKERMLKFFTSKVAEILAKNPGAKAVVALDLMQRDKNANNPAAEDYADILTRYFSDRIERLLIKGSLKAEETGKIRESGINVTSQNYEKVSRLTLMNQKVLPVVRASGESYQTSNKVLWPVGIRYDMDSGTNPEAAVMARFGQALFAVLSAFLVKNPADAEELRREFLKALTLREDLGNSDSVLSFDAQGHAFINARALQNLMESWETRQITQASA